MRTLRRSVFFLLLLGACSDAAVSSVDPGDAGPNDETTDDEPTTDAAATSSAPRKDAGSDAGGRRDAASADAASTDAAVVVGDAASADAATAPTSGPLDVSCDLNPPTVSPDGRVIAYDDCQGHLVVRNVVTGAVATSNVIGWERASTAAGLVYSNGDGLTTHVVDWSGNALASFAYLGDLSRVRNVGTGWTASDRVLESVDGGVAIFFRTATGAPSLVESLRATSTDSPSLDTITSDDGMRVAAIERPSSGVPRLTLAATSANAAVATVSLAGYDHPRWIPSGVHGTSALFVASRKLYEVSLVSGTIRALSTGPVIAKYTAGLQVPSPDFAHVVTSGSHVYWLESGPGSSYALVAWDRAASASPPSTIASGSDVNGAAPVPNVDNYPVLRGLALTGDGSRLLFFVEDAINHAHWKAIDLGSHAVSALEEGGYEPSIGGGARIAIGSPPVFRDLATGESRAVPLRSETDTGIVTPDGTLVLARVTSATSTTAAVSFERLDFASGSTLLLALPASAENGVIARRDYVPVFGGVVVRVVDSVLAPASSKPKYRLYLAR